MRPTLRTSAAATAAKGPRRRATGAHVAPAGARSAQRSTLSAAATLLAVAPAYAYGTEVKITNVGTQGSDEDGYYCAVGCRTERIQCSGGQTTLSG